MNNTHIETNYNVHEEASEIFEFICFILYCLTIGWVIFGIKSIFSRECWKNCVNDLKEGWIVYSIIAFVGVVIPVTLATLSSVFGINIL